jgi:hypothetical protein
LLPESAYAFYGCENAIARLFRCLALRVDHDFCEVVIGAMQDEMGVEVELSGVEDRRSGYAGPLMDSSRSGSEERRLPLRVKSADLIVVQFLPVFPAKRRVIASISQRCQHRK